MGIVCFMWFVIGVWGAGERGFRARGWEGMVGERRKEGGCGEVGEEERLRETENRVRR